VTCPPPFSIARRTRKLTYDEREREHRLNRRQFCMNLARRLACTVGTLPSFKPQVQAASGNANPFAYERRPIRADRPKADPLSRGRSLSLPRPEPRRWRWVRTERCISRPAFVVRLAGDGAVISDKGRPDHCVGVASDGLLYVGMQDHIEVFRCQGQPEAAGIRRRKTG